MEDKPTLKEYMLFGIKRYVRTNEGRYFACTLPVITIRIIILLMYMVFLFIITGSSIPWRFSIFYDLIMIFIIYIFIEPRLFYRWEKFELIKQDSYEYQKASERFYFKQKTISVIMTIWKLLLACLAAVFFLFGYIFSYLRSLIDTQEGQCTIKWEQGDELTLDTEDGDTTIALPVETDGDVRIVMKTGRTPFAPQLTIDGNAIEAIGSHHITHWDSKSNILKDYFLQSYTYTIPADDIHDGSVLTLTCGKWSYEWTFVSNAP